MADFTIQFLADQIATIQNQFNFLIDTIRSAHDLGDVQEGIRAIADITLSGPQTQDYSGKWAIEFLPSSEQIKVDPRILERDLILRDDEGSVSLYDSQDAAVTVGQRLLPRLEAAGFRGYSVVKFGGHN